MLQIGKTRNRRRRMILSECGGGEVITGQSIAALRQTAGNDVEHGVIAVGAHLLREMGDAHAGPQPDLALVGRNLASEQPHQRRFALAVAADETYAFAAADSLAFTAPESAAHVHTRDGEMPATALRVIAGKATMPGCDSLSAPLPCSAHPNDARPPPLPPPHHLRHWRFPRTPCADARRRRDSRVLRPYLSRDSIPRSSGCRAWR